MYDRTPNNVSGLWLAKCKDKYFYTVVPSLIEFIKDVAVFLYATNGK